MTSTPNTAPYVGMPATIHLVSDALPAVVIRVNRKSVTVRRVATDESSRQRINDVAEPFPCWAWDGLTDQPIGEPERFPMIAPGRYRNGSIGLSLGRAVKITDYRH